LILGGGSTQQRVVPPFHEWCVSRSEKWLESRIVLVLYVPTLPFDRLFHFIRDILRLVFAGTLLNLVICRDFVGKAEI